MKRHIQVLCGLVLASLVLPTGGCSLFGDKSKGTTVVKTSNGSIPVRREASTVVDLAQPTVAIDDDLVIVTGNARLRGTFNPDARIQISIIDKYGQLVGNKINAKLVETEQDRIMTYRVKFGPIPSRGASLLVAYDDYRPIANYSADYIGSGGSGGGGGGKGSKGSTAGISNKGVGTKSTKTVK